jgi:glycopeptide antibiotics resistance protein
VEYPRKWEQERQPLTFAPRMLAATAVLYAVVVALITIVPLRATNDKATHVNVVPFGSVVACISGKSHGIRQLPRRCIGNVLGNVLLFVPFGILFTAITNRYRSPAVLLVAASLSSAAIEAIQYAERTVPIGRTVDIDDVLWNTTGALAGFMIVRMWRESPGSRPG